MDCSNQSFDLTFSRFWGPLPVHVPVFLCTGGADHSCLFSSDPTIVRAVGRDDEVDEPARPEASDHWRDRGDLDRESDRNWPGSVGFEQRTQKLPMTHYHRGKRSRTLRGSCVFGRLIGSLRSLEARVKAFDSMTFSHKKALVLVVVCTKAYGFLNWESSTCLQSDLRFGAQALVNEGFSEVCCKVPQHYAEPAGSLNRVPFWKEVNEEAGVVTFYDAQCGIPLFKAPKGRSLKDFKSESQHHGWPSFREEELVKKNVEIREGGEVVSKCGTHLGHNLPDAKGNRYCIDLLCIAGHPK